MQSSARSPSSKDYGSAEANIGRLGEVSESTADNKSVQTSDEPTVAIILREEKKPFVPKDLPAEVIEQ